MIIFLANLSVITKKILNKFCVFLVQKEKGEKQISFINYDAIKMNGKKSGFRGIFFKLKKVGVKPLTFHRFNETIYELSLIKNYKEIAITKE